MAEGHRRFRARALSSASERCCRKSRTLCSTPRSNMSSDPTKLISSRLSSIGEFARSSISAAEFSCQPWRSEEHTSELQSRQYLVCRLLLEKKKKRHT